MNKINLYCFPYAGGSAMIYNKWRPYLNKNIEIVPIELAGRGRRIQDPCYSSMDEVVEDVFEIIHKELDGSFYSLFGHSMGGIVAYELAQKLFDANFPLPVHLFLSGRSAPHAKRKEDKQFHLMSDVEFRQEVIKLGGTPKEFFQHPELVEIMLPLLRNDFKINETYQPPQKIRPLNCDLTIFMGREDDMTEEQVHGWRDYTSKNCRIHFFSGNHFFIHQEIENIAFIINRTLANG